MQIFVSPLLSKAQSVCCQEYGLPGPAFQREWKGTLSANYLRLAKVPTTVPEHQRIEVIYYLSGKGLHMLLTLT